MVHNIIIYNNTNHTLDNNGHPTHYEPLPYKILDFYNHKQN